MNNLPHLEYVQRANKKNTLKGGRVPLVYFFVCEDGMVVYVGRTDRFATRWKQHLMSDKAMHLVHRVELHVMDSDAEAHFYETEMILKYGPLWNSIGRHAKPSKLAVQPVDVIHYKSTACARFVLPYARYAHACYTVKNRDIGKETTITVSRGEVHIGTIVVQNDLSSIDFAPACEDHYFKSLCERMKYCTVIGKEAYAILEDKIGFIDTSVPTGYTKCLWHGAHHRNRTGDYWDDSEWDETGIMIEHPALEDYLPDYVPHIGAWYTPPGY